MSISPEACSFCAFGAVNRVSLNTQYSSRVLKFLDKLMAGFPAFNDAPFTTHADIMALFDRAIEAAKEEENHDV